MDLPGAPREGEFPIARSILPGGCAFRRSIQSESAADAVILSAKEPEYISKRGVAPVQRDFRGLQSSRGTGNIAMHPDPPSRLQRNAAAPRLGFELQLPAAARDLFHASRNARECKGKLVITGFKIDAPVVKPDFFQAIYWSNGRGGAVSSGSLRNIGLCRRKPSFQVPAAFLIAHEDQAWFG